MTAALLSAARIPVTSRTSPTADRTAPTTSNGRLGSAGSGSRTRRANRTITATISAWNPKAARQLIAEVMTPPISGPAAAPTPPRALTVPNALARAVRSVKYSVVRM